MGLEITTILLDEFDWDYVGKTKKDAIKEIKKDFKKEAGFEPEVVAEWYRHIVLDCGKFPISADEYKDIILRHCDSAIHWNDSEPWKKEKLENNRTREIK